MIALSKYWIAAIASGMLLPLIGAVIAPTSSAAAQKGGSGLTGLPPHFDPHQFDAPDLRQFDGPVGPLQAPHVPPTVGSPQKPDHPDRKNDPDPDSPPDPPSKVTRTYRYVACGRSNDESDDCQNSTSEATKVLIEAMSTEFVSGAAKRTLTLQIPETVDKAEQIKIIFALESAAVGAVHLQLSNEIRALVPFQNQRMSYASAQLAVAQQVTAVKNIHQQARAEANSGQNWSHDFQQGNHTFHSGAYNQATIINLKRSDWGEH